jgi:hypothetical protein
MFTSKQLCRSSFLAVRYDQQDTLRYKGFLLRCKTWDCPHCRSIKAAAYRERMTQLWQKPQLYMYTLTYFHDKRPDDAWATYNAAWNKLRTNLRKQYGHFSFVRVLESHNASPYPHLHIICDMYFPPKKLHSACISAGFGYQISGKKITGTGAANYITKYLTKEWSNEQSKILRKTSRCRLISFSADIIDRLPDSEPCQVIGISPDLTVCRDCCIVDFQWKYGRGAKITYEKMSSDKYEVTVMLDELCTRENEVQSGLCV